MLYGMMMLMMLCVAVLSFAAGYRQAVREMGR